MPVTPGRGGGQVEVRSELGPELDLELELGTMIEKKVVGSDEADEAEDDAGSFSKPATSDGGTTGPGPRK